MRQRHADTAEWVKYASKPYYLNDKSGDYHYGKDIRIFSMGNWFREIFDIHIRLCEDWQIRHEKPLWRVDLLDSILTLCREGIAPFSQALIGAKRIRRAAAFSSFFVNFSACVGVVLTASLSSAGALGAMCAWHLSLFLLLWLVPVLLISLWTTQY